jgi:hypothetical protein
MSYIKNIVFTTIVLGGLFLSLAYLAPIGQTANSNCRIECKTCADTCEQTLNYCRKHGGNHLNAEHLKALQDCISNCKQSADSMIRGSTLQNSACALCEKACLSCAESCAAFKGDKTMQACAKECKKCASFCNKMAK